MANPNPNQENLRKFSDMSENEKRKIQSLGREANKKKQREQKTLRETIKMIMGMEAKDSSSIEKMQEAGISESITNATMVGLALVEKAKKGNIPAQRLLAEMMGENDTQGTVINQLPPTINVNFVDGDKNGH